MLLVAVIALCLTGLSMTGALIWNGIRLGYFAGQIRQQLFEHEVRITNLEKEK